MATDDDPGGSGGHCAVGCGRLRDLRARGGSCEQRTTARAAARLRSVGEKTDIPQVQRATEVYANVQLQVNNANQLSAAADQIAQLGYEFAADTAPDALDSIEPFIPPSDRWK